MAGNKLLFSFVILLGSLFLLPSLAFASLPADLEPDGDVDLLDFNLFLANFGKTGTPGWIRADIKSDGAVNLLDFNLLTAGFGQTESTPTPLPPPPSPQSQDTGIWISPSDLMARPTSGSAWQAILSDASSSWGSANVADQDSNHDQKVLAGSLACARTGQYCDKTVQGLLSAIDTENGARWLAIGRNILSYTIAADVMQNSGRLTGSDLSKVQAWLARFLTRTLAHNNSGVQEKLTPFGSGSNASAQEGAVYAAIAAYTKDTIKLNYVWNRFRLYSCDLVNNPEQTIDVSKGFEGGWSFATNRSEACPVNPKGFTKDGHRLDGAVINDIVRGGSFKWPPGYTGYEMTGLQGYVSAATIFHQAGFPAFAVKDQAVLRAMDFVCHLENATSTNWWEPSRGRAIMHLVRVAYHYNPPGCPYSYPVGDGMIIGYTDWTHPYNP